MSKDLADGVISKAEYMEWKVNWPQDGRRLRKGRVVKEAAKVVSLSDVRITVAFTPFPKTLLFISHQSESSPGSHGTVHRNDPKRKQKFFVQQLAWCDGIDEVDVCFLVNDFPFLSSIYGAYRGLLGLLNVAYGLQ